MRKMTLLVVMAAIAIPATALAAKPSHPSTPASTHTHSGTTTGNAEGTSAKVLFVLRGTIMSYTAGTNVSIKVTGSNHEANTLKTMTLSFPLNSKTKIVGTVKASDTGIVKLDAPKNTSANVLQTLDAFQVIDQHAAA